MPANSSQSLPPLGSSLLEALARLAQTLALSDNTVAELAWAAFYRKWDGVMLEAWARATKSLGDRARIPTGPMPGPKAIDARSPWAYAELGLQHGVLPGQAIFGEKGVEQAWLDDRPVSLKTYRRATEELLRDQAAVHPNGAFAKELAALDRERRRARQTWAVVVSADTGRQRTASKGRHRNSRSPRRTGRSAASRKATARSGDPPEPPPTKAGPLAHGSAD